MRENRYGYERHNLNTISISDSSQNLSNVLAASDNYASESKGIDA